MESSQLALTARADRLRGFDDLPSDALIDIRSLAAVQGCGESAAWVRAKTDPAHPRALVMSAKCTRWRVGSVRAYLRVKAGELAEAA